MRSIDDWFAAARCRGLSLWGKARPRRDAEWPIHSLACHSVDVAEVARVLYTAASPRVRAAVGVPEGAVVAAAAAHDLGHKANPAFQHQIPEVSRRLGALGLGVGLGDPGDGVRLGAPAAEALARAGFGPDAARELGRAAAAHHGRVPTDLDMRPRGRARRGDVAWDAARAELSASVLDAIGAEPVESVTAPAAAWVAGLVTAADWIASDAAAFPYEQPVHPSEYRAVAAARAVAATSWVRPAPEPRDVAFSDVFGGRAARGCQLVEVDDCAVMAVVEAPTGSGKTAAALYLAERWGGGLCYTCPTQAVAEQVLRDVAALGHRDVHLAHGRAAVSPAYEALRAGGTTSPWLRGNRRAMTAPYVVSTVDQALLSVLAVRHGMIRLYGLAGKVVVLDEVHSYDPYTLRLVERLVEWLVALGSRVVVLSATLPRATRAALVAAAGGSPDGLSAAAPRVAVVGDTTRDVGVPDAPRRVRVRRLPGSRTAVVRALSRALAGGGAAGWICNTVARAQGAYRAVQEAVAAGEFPPCRVVLVHGRLPPEQRLPLERWVSATLGPAGERPERVVVVGTQVLEHGLDVDFDVLVTDVAPVDLLVQRVGRLHRHPRGRPWRLAEPVAYIVGATDDDREVLRRGVVYHAFTLLRAADVIDAMPRDRAGAVLDGSAVEALVERAYRAPDGDDPDDTAAAHRDFDAAGDRMRFGAAQVALPPPRLDDALSNHAATADDLEPEEGGRTRWTVPSVEAACLFSDGTGVYADPGCTVPVALDRCDDPRELTRVVLNRTVRLSSRRLVPELLAQPVPVGWADVPGIQRVRAVVFVDGSVEIGGRRVDIDPELGLVIR